MRYFLFYFFLCAASCNSPENKPVAESARQQDTVPGFKLNATPLFLFNSFVDCNMATVWIKDTFRIFPGKYGEDPLWGNAHDLKYASGNTVDEVFGRSSKEFTEPKMPRNSKPRSAGLHGAVWFETLYKDPKDTTEKTLYALYHNENFPSTLPYDSISGTGYRDISWPQGLKGPDTKAAVCRIGIMKSLDGGRSWLDNGILLEDHQPRLILKPHNTGINFAGGVGDPSAVANGDYLYVFYGEYGYPGRYDSVSYDTAKEWGGQCISVARILLSDLDHPAGKAKRWDGNGFNAKSDSMGAPIASIQIAPADGGGPTSSPTAKYYWGPSVSWNTWLNCWVMLMARAEGPSWKGNELYISFNKNPDLGTKDHSQQWSVPRLLTGKSADHTLWYPSLQPLSTEENKARKFTSVYQGQKARLFYKDIQKNKGPYLSEYIVEFFK